MVIGLAVWVPILLGALPGGLRSSSASAEKKTSREGQNFLGLLAAVHPDGMARLGA